MANLNTADFLARFLKKNNITHAFGIIGAGNAQIFDSIFRLGYTKIICVHHEQAAIMSAISYYRVSKKIAPVFLTTGAGSSNGVTGVVSAWMDSIPVLVISGNENSKFTNEKNKLRIWGVQGYDSTYMVKKITKFSYRIMSPNILTDTLKKSLKLTSSGRPGPVWLDIPMNIQSAIVDKKSFVENNKIPVESKQINKQCLSVKDGVKITLSELSKSKKPLLYLGHGIRLANADKDILSLLKNLKIPFLLSWQASDLVDNRSPYYFGKAGVYGQRSSNFIIQNCDLLLCIGTRLAIPQIGYNHNDFARNAKIISVDIDLKELTKFGNRINHKILSDAGEYIRLLQSSIKSTRIQIPHFATWLEYCNTVKSKYNLIEDKTHDDIKDKQKTYINSYRFMDKLVNYLNDDEIIVTDMGTALLSGHQILRLNGNQRLITSTGLGEMGYGLPGAIGAAFASKKPVMCLNCDGGMMLNLQELQTIKHHKLPIKLFIFNNDGYLMIKHTQKSLFNSRYTSINAETGVTCPDFAKIATAFDFKNYKIHNWKDFDKYLPVIKKSNEPLICEIFMHPDQPFLPKLAAIRNKDGTISSPKLEELSPLIDEHVRVDFHK